MHAAKLMVLTRDRRGRPLRFVPKNPAYQHPHTTNLTSHFHSSTVRLLPGLRVALMPDFIKVPFETCMTRFRSLHEPLCFAIRPSLMDYHRSSSCYTPVVGVPKVFFREHIQTVAVFAVTVLLSINLTNQMFSTIYEGKRKAWKRSLQMSVFAL